MSIWMLLIPVSSLKKFHGINFIAKLITVSVATNRGVISLSYTHCYTPVCLMCGVSTSLSPPEQ